MSENSAITDHILIADNAAFSGNGTQFPGTSGNSANGQPTAAENGTGQFPWRDLVPSRVEEIAMRGNGYVLAVSGGIAVCAGALLPFMWHAQASVDGAQVLSGFGIGLGYRVISFLFGALLAGLAYWTRRNPARRRPIAMAALVTSVLGFAGYFLYALVGISGLTVTSDLGPAHVSWYPSIGLLLSVAGCAACAIAAIVMRRTRQFVAGSVLEQVAGGARLDSREHVGGDAPPGQLGYRGHGIAPGDDAGHLRQAFEQPVIKRNGRAELDPLLGFDPLGERGRAVQRHNLARVDQRHPVAQPLGLLHEVGNEHDRDSPVAHALDQLPGVVPGLRVQAGGELVQHRHAWVADQCQRDGQPLLLAAGELAERRPGLPAPLCVLCRLTRGNRQPCHPVGDRRVATARLAGQKLTEGQPGRGIARVRHRGLPGLHTMHERDA